MKGARALLSLFVAEGLIAFLGTLFTPSESGRVVFLWLSHERILLLVLILAFWVALVVAAAGFVAFPSRPRPGPGEARRMVPAIEATGASGHPFARPPAPDPGGCLDGPVYAPCVLGLSRLGS